MKISIPQINFTKIKDQVLLNATNLLIRPKLIRDYDEYYLSLMDLFINFFKIYGYMLLIIISFYRSVALCIIVIPFALIIPFFMKPILVAKRKNKLLGEFKDFLRSIKGNMEASYSIENCFFMALPEIKMLYGDESLMYKELINMCKYIKMNVPIDRVFREFARKTKVEDIEDFSDALSMVKAMGGNINKVINNVISIINDRIEVLRDISLSTASKKFEQSIMSLLPFFIIIYLNFTSKDFLRPLYSTIIGRLFMTILLGVYFISVYIGKKILDIKV